jgi:hypothetical protein
MNTKTPTGRTYHGFYGKNLTPQVWPDGTWLEPEEFAYPDGGFTRRALARCADGRMHACRVSIPDTFFSIPARAKIDGVTVRGFLSSDESGLTFTQTYDVDQFTQAYIACALWSSTDDKGVNDLADALLLQITIDCAIFQKTHKRRIKDRATRAGCDFWLTRNRHGAGFWDGDWPTPDAKIMTDDSHAWGSVDLYLGDDGKVHGS